MSESNKPWKEKALIHMRRKNTPRGLIAIHQSTSASGHIPCVVPPPGRDKIFHQCMNNNKCTNIQKENTNNNNYTGRIEKTQIIIQKENTYTNKFTKHPGKDRTVSPN